MDRLVGQSFCPAKIFSSTVFAFSVAYERILVYVYFVTMFYLLQTPAKALGMIAELEVPTVPPPEWQFSAEPPSISALEL